jgi:prolyl-tRNA synthetase
MPIYRDAEERAKVMPVVQSLKNELMAQQYAGAAIRVEIDDRDVRGGEKKWHHVKRGVPIRLEVGPKDIEKDSVFFSRRDQPKSQPMGRSELVSNIGNILTEMQAALFDRALQLRNENTVSISTVHEFRKYFANEDENAIHGGFAYAYFADEKEIEPLLKELKVTIRCIPKENNETPGTCFFSGKPVAKKAIFAKSY